MRGFARYGLPPLVWMAVIWVLSSDAGSSEYTGRLFHRVVNALFPWAPPAQVDLAHLLVRKLGHLVEYGILAVLWFRALHAGRGLGPSPSAWAALSISVVWAVLDELHQVSVASRTGSAVDVALDAVGATLAALAARRRSEGRRTISAISATGTSG